MHTYLWAGQPANSTSTAMQAVPMPMARGAFVPSPIASSHSTMEEMLLSPGHVPAGFHAREQTAKDLVYNQAAATARELLMLTAMAGGGGRGSRGPSPNNTAVRMGSPRMLRSARDFRCAVCSNSFEYTCVRSHVKRVPRSSRDFRCAVVVRNRLDSCNGRR